MSRSDLGRQLCEAFGLDPTLVKRLTFSVDASDVMHVGVDLIPDESHLKDAEAVFASYRYLVIDPAGR
jgi:hypothetical protein